MIFEAGLHVEYLPLTADTLARGDDVLGVATFRAGAEPYTSDAIPVANIRMPVLGPNASVCEVWRVRAPLESGQRTRVRYRCSAQFLFGCVRVPESDGLQAATREAYQEMLGTLEDLAYPHLVRVWNYLPQINLEADGSE